MIHRRIGSVRGKPFPAFVARNPSTDPDEPYYVSAFFDEETGYHYSGGDSIEEAVDALAEQLRT